MLFKKEKDIKVARMLFVTALAVGAGQIVSGQDRSPADQVKAKRDQLRIAVQRICPISGNKLGANGAPLKVKVGQGQCR